MRAWPRWWRKISRMVARVVSPRPPRFWSTGARLLRPSRWKTLPRPLTPNLPQPNKPVALVTGASRGIGRAIAVELSKSHQVVGTYRANRDAPESLREETGAEIVPSDIGSADDREKLVAHIRATHLSLDLLLNNAGL